MAIDEHCTGTVEFVRGMGISDLLDHWLPVDVTFALTD